MARIIECVPNCSEGRNKEVIEYIADAVRSVPGVALMDYSSDENHNRSVFTIVGGAESDAHEGKISNESPVGQALLGCKKGDEVTTTGPTGRDIKLTVIKIEH